MAGELVALASNLKPKPGPDDFEEIGISLDLPFGTWNEEIFNPSEATVPDLLIRLDQMQRTDGHMRALYRLLSLPFRRAGFDMQPAEAGEEEAEFVEKVLTLPPYEGGMTTSFDYVRALMCRSFVYGFQVFEKVWQVADMAGSSGWGSAITLRKLAPRANHTVRFRVDDNGGFDGVVQRAYNINRSAAPVTIPKEKVFFFTVDKEEHPFYGRSMFEPALYHFDKKHKLYYIAHIAAQMAAVPARLAFDDNADLTPTQKLALRSGLASLGFNSAMLVPKGVRIEPFGNNVPIGDSILALINHHNIQSSQAVLAQFIDLSMGGSGGTGSYALSKDGSDLFLMCLETLLSSAAEHLNFYVVPQLIDWNFGSRKYPQIIFEPLADDMRAAMVEVFQAIATSKDYRGTTEFLFELEKQITEGLGLSVDYDKIEDERSKAVDQAQNVVTAIQSLTGNGVGAPAPADPGAPGAAPSAPVAASDTAEALIRLADRQADRERLAGFSRVGEIGKDADVAHASLVVDVQARLVKLGYDVADEDGFGAKTVKAVKAFQEFQGLPATGRVDLGTFAMLLEQGKKTPTPA